MKSIDPTKKKTLSTTTKLSSEEIVTKCLQSTKGLIPLKGKLIDTIETLGDHFIREEICMIAISLLQSKIRFER